MTPVGEVFLAIFLTLVFFGGLVLFCRYFCANSPVTCESRRSPSPLLSAVLLLLLGPARAHASFLRALPLSALS